MVYLSRPDKAILKTQLTLFATALLILILSSTGFAATKIKIKPMITAGVGYDSNFHKTENHERAVMTYTAMPGIQFGLETAKLGVLLNYTLEGYLYDDISGGSRGYQATSDLAYIGHLGALNARYRATDRLTLVLDDGFYLSRYPTYYDRLSEVIERRKYWINRLTPGVFYDFEHRITAGLRYRWTEKHYLESREAGDEGNSTEHRAMLNLIYNPTRTTTLDLNYHIWFLNYHGDDWGDYTSNQVKLAFQKRHKYLAFDAGFGWHFRTYHASGRSSENAPAVKVSALWQNPPPPEGRRHLGKLFLRPRSQVYVAAESNFNHFGAGFKGYRFTLDAGHVFLEKIHARAKGWYQISDYVEYEGPAPSRNQKNRLDGTYDVSGSIAYLFTDRLALSLTAGRQERVSNLAGFDYANNYMILKFDLNYDFASRGSFTEEVLYY